MPAFPRHLALLLVLPLAACSSGGGGGGSDGSDTIPGSFSGRADLYNANLNRIGWTDVDPDPNYTDPSTLPQTGSAAFQGVMYVEDITEGRDLLGRAQLDVSFSGNDISGSATDFRDTAGVLHDGTLILDGADTIDRSADVESTYTYGLEVDGSLVYPDTGTQVFDGQLWGDFYRGDAEYIYADSQDGFLQICDAATDLCRDEFAGVVARDTD